MSPLNGRHEPVSEIIFCFFDRPGRAWYNDYTIRTRSKVMTEEQAPLSEQELQKIREALKEVYDPEIGISVVDLGLVRKIEGVEGEVHITMILTTPFCPLAGMILEQARAAVQEVTDRPVRVTLGNERWDPSMMAEAERKRLGFS